MPGFVPGIHAVKRRADIRTLTQLSVPPALYSQPRDAHPDVDGWDTPGHDAERLAPLRTADLSRLQDRLPLAQRPRDRFQASLNLALALQHRRPVRFGEHGAQ